MAHPIPLTLELIRQLPKVELHVHLDTSVRPRTAGELAAVQGIHLPHDLEGALVCPPVCSNLADYLTRVDTALECSRRLRRWSASRTSW
jgi:adenosine deaminase